jgi:hypothetical protein
MALPVLVTNTVMRSREDKLALASECLAFCERLATEPPSETLMRRMGVVA